MKRHVQLPGVRKWAGDHLIELQSEPLRVLDGFFGSYGPFVLKGCEAVAAGGVYNVASGLVVLGGKDRDGNDAVMIVPFEGASGVPLPLYLTLDSEVRQRPYNDGVVRPIAYDYYAKASTVQPAAGTPYLELKAAGTPRFVDKLLPDWDKYARKDGTYPGLTAGNTPKLGGRPASDYMLREELEGIDLFRVGEHRLIRNEIPFNDPRYLPMNGSRMLVSDNPDMPFPFPISMINEVVTIETTHETYLQLVDISFGNGMYVGIDVNGDVAHSTDLKNWTIESLLPEYTRGAAFGNGIWIAGGEKGVYRSTDSVTWTKVSSLALTYIRFGGGVFVMIAGSSIYTSTDGLTFTQRSTPQGPNYEVDYHNGLWVACSGYGVITSSDLATWTKRGPTSGYSTHSVSYCHDKWVCGCQSGRILISDDGITWSVKTVTGYSSAVTRSVYFDGKYIVVNQNTFYMTTDFTTWTTKTVSSAGYTPRVLYLEGGGMALYGRQIVLFDMWYELPNYSNANYTSYLKVYEE